MTTKVCSKCGIEKDVGEFHRNKSKKDGLSGECKVCVKAWRDANLEAVKAGQKAWREANPEAAKANNKAWRETNREAVKAKNKAYYEANPEAVKARRKAYLEANLEAAKANNKAWRETNREAVKAKNKAYREALADPYIKATLKQLGVEPTTETIEAQRIRLKVIRKVKEINDLNNPKENENDH